MDQHTSPTPPRSSARSAQIRRREREKLSVAEAAAAAGAPALTWYAWEAGRHLRLERLPVIAEALGCKAKALIPE